LECADKSALWNDATCRVVGSGDTSPHSKPAAAYAALDGIAELTFIWAMTVTLTAEQEQFITEQLNDGHYRSASDVIAQSLGMLRAQEEFIRSNTAELREKIAVGLGQIKRGEVVDGRKAIQNLREKLRRREHGKG
jgi:antitoxin ParD1/3/4